MTQGKISASKQKSQLMPEHSHLMYSVVGMLMSSDTSGVELRKALSALVAKNYSGPAFYQLMSRMDDLRLVEVFDVDVKVNRYVAKERRYRILPDGIAAVKKVRHFYKEFV